jgi:3-hydroxyisobutyrate dehydrogenase-like beta-hydroxyacid dehydrogenase
MRTIAFIGLGNMGGHMTRRLMSRGLALRVYARRRETMAPFVAEGAVATDSPKEAAQGADVVMTNITTTGDVEEVLLGEQGVVHGARAGTIVCDFSTIDAATTRQIAAHLNERGVDFLDCPVSGGVRAAEAGTLSMMVGGDAAVLTRVRELLDALATNVFHMGAVGTGQVTKACNQIVQVVTIQGIAEAMHFAKQQGADSERVVEALMAGFASSKMLGLMGPKMAARDFAAGIEARLHHKDFGLIAGALARQDMHLPAVSLVSAQLEKLMQSGWGQMDTCNLLRVLEQDNCAEGGGNSQ